MERVNKILNHDLFNEYLKKNRMAEENRRFCHHDMQHFLDVARLAMIFKLQGKERGVCEPEDNGSVESSDELNCAEVSDELNCAEASDELIYAAALLHDIGRWKQYEDGTPHEKVSAQLASEILADCGFTEKETTRIVTAIANHRNEAIKTEQTLDGILYRADKMSRSCFCCEMERECDWKGSKKNLRLQY